MRLFVGISLAGAVVQDLQLAVAKLRSNSGRDAPLRWTAPESWHITLQFLGNATDEQFTCLAARLSGVRSAPVAIDVGRIGCFDRAGVLFADVHVTPELEALAHLVMAAASRCRFAAQSRPFHPHITLARQAGSEKRRERENEKTGLPGPVSRRALNLRELVDRLSNMPLFSRFTAQDILLYESHLSATGSRYEVRGRFPLRNA